ncbi:MAG: methyltransferase domain-containing protein [Phycisphaera sp.]|nr:methyltransferase domain-containing protein [Phycisphaera sp.]
MDTQNTTPRWRLRVAEIDSEFDELRLPSGADDGVSQDKEWCDLVVDGQTRRIRFHDYHDVFKVPGLYEHLFYHTLECCSPTRVTRLLADVLLDHRDCPDDLHVLDVGAGNGMVGDELDARGVQKIVGIDIIPEAREATLRDRPGLYHDYLVTDLTNLPERDEETLRKHQFNCLTTVAALGFGDIPPRAFVKALDLIETPGWIAFNIKEDFIHERDASGFCRLIRRLARDEVIQPQAYRRYPHRLSVAGEPLHYVGMVARKLRDVPDDMLECDF